MRDARINHRSKSEELRKNALVQKVNQVKIEHNNDSSNIEEEEKQEIVLNNSLA